MRTARTTRQSVFLAAGMLLLFLSSASFAVLIIRTGEEFGDDELLFLDWINDKREIYQKLGRTVNSFRIDGSPAVPENSRNSYSGGGYLLWKVEVPGGQGDYLSTPLLVDLNDDKKMEVVVMSAGDVVMAYDSAGDPFWESPNTDIVIDFLGQTPGTSGLDFDPPHLFASPKSFDLNDGQGPGILVGGKDGLYCLDPNGDLRWSSKSTTGYYFSSPAITDVQGKFPVNMSEWEIVVTSDDMGRRGWIEVLHMNGTLISRSEAPSGGEGCLIGGATVAEDLDGSFWDGPWKVTPDPYEETTLEFMFGNHDQGLRVWSWDASPDEGPPRLRETTSGWLGGHQTYATTAVANVTGGPEAEIFIGCSEGYPRTWTGWGGKLYVYTQQGKKLWDYSTGSSRASIFSSPAIADIQQAKFDPEECYFEYEVVFGSDNGKLYVMSTEYHSLLWSFDTGGRVFSSPAICDINGDKELEIIVGSDSGKVFCFDGDPTDGIDDGTSYPGDGKGHDVLWVYNSTGAIGPSSPVVADIDLDGRLEVLIGDMQGNLHCISAGGRSRVGQVDWPSFHLNNNNTGFYNPDIRYVIDLHPRVYGEGNVTPTSTNLKPGGAHTFDLTLSNRGTVVSPLKEMVYVSVVNSSIPEGWMTYLDTPPCNGDDNPPYLKLSPATSQNLSLTVWAPLDATESMVARFIVRANHTLDEWARDEILLQVNLEFRPEVEVSFDHPVEDDPLSPRLGMKWESIGQGATYDVEIEVRNLGTVNDTMSVELSEPPLDAGWNWYFIENGRSNLLTDLPAPHLSEIFGGEPWSRFTVRVTAPFEAIADQDIPLLVEATSLASIETFEVKATSSDTLYMIVTEENGLWLDLVQPRLLSAPNSVATLDLRITNLGNNDAIHVSLENSTMPSQWRVKLPQGPVLVIKGQTRTVPIEVTFPAGLQAGFEVILTLRGWIVDSTHISSRVSTILEVEQVHDHQIMSYGEEVKDILPGASANFTVFIANHGNGEEVFVFHPPDSPGWTCLVIDPQGRVLDEVIIDPFSQVELIVIYRAPAGARAGLWKMALAISTWKGVEYLRSDLMVQQVHSFTMLGTSGEGEVSIEAQMDLPDRFFCVVSNTGNGPDQAVVKLGGMGPGGSLTGLPDGTLAGLISVSLTRTPGGIPQYFDPAYKLDLTGRSAGKLFIPYDRATSGPMSGYRSSGTTDLTIELSSGMSAYLEFWVKRVSSPDRMMVRETPLLAGAFSEGVRATLPVRINYLYPELYIVGEIEVAGSSLESSDRAERGDRLTFIVKVGNNGETAARDVVVQLYVDGRQISNMTLPHVPPTSNDFKVAMLSWEAEEGKHRITMAIDPGDSIVELNEVDVVSISQENEVSMTLKVGGNERALGFFVAVIGLIVILLVLLVAAAAWLVKRFRIGRS
ncbi:MAG: CARDB domain-containing protein [Thermoplasmatota archaeon]